MGSYTFKTSNRALGVTPVSNIFIDEYMPMADGNFVKVYLAGLAGSIRGIEISGEALSKKLGLLESDVIKAWEYWESKGLLKIARSNADMEIEFMPVNPPELMEQKFNPNSDKYSTEYVTSRMADPRIKAMYDDIQELLGRILPPMEFATYLSWIDDYNFTPEIIILLIGYCKSMNKSDMRYMEKVAISWHESGITTLDDAQKYISHHEEKYNNYRLVLDFLGLRENEIMKPQQDFLDKWFNTWSFSLEMVLEACKICSLRINEPNFSYIDGILTKWHKNGIKTLKDIENQEPPKKNRGTKYKAPVTTFNSFDQRSYDMKDLEKKLLGRDGEEENEQ